MVREFPNYSSPAFVPDDSTVFPADCEAEFIGEGAANVVFHVRLRNGKRAFPGYLLRVPKAGTKAFSYKELQEYWETIVAPLFEEGRLVKQSLISLKGSGIIPKLNAVLARIQSSRRKDFQGSTVADAEYGMLVEDMSARYDHEVTLEFKPKWLLQSPAAPTNATRCRNCAREAYRANKDGKTLGSKDNPSPLCPLDLIYLRRRPYDYDPDNHDYHDGQEDPKCETCEISTALLLGSGQLADDPGEVVLYKSLLSRWIRSNGLLPALKSAQAMCEAAGLPGDEELNMTLRDCTCFVRLSQGGPPEAKLGDLDRKNGEAKREYWEAMERKLVEGGYYEGKEVPKQTTHCWLEGVGGPERREALQNR